MKRIIAHIVRPFMGIGAVVLLSGCQFFGPNSIDLGRTNYNDAIQRTSAVQALANIVRVYDQEMPLVMDISEVDATLTVQTTLTSMISGIAARATTAGGTLIGSGSFSNGLEYQESPTVRYLPLSGEPLIAQLSSPIDVGSISYLSDSDWDLASILTFSVNYATPRYKDKWFALNAIFELDNMGALTLAATKSDLTSVPPPSSASNDNTQGGRQGGGKSNTVQNAAASPADSLTLYLEPDHSAGDKKEILRLWLRLLALYGDNQPASAQPQSPPMTRRAIIQELRDYDLKDKKQASLSRDINEALASLPRWIELRTVPLPAGGIQRVEENPQQDVQKTLRQDDQDQQPEKGCGVSKGAALGGTCANTVPLMRTHSALGVLKNATDRQVPYAEFITPERFSGVVSSKELRNSGIDWNTIPDFYTFASTDEHSICDPRFGNVAQMVEAGDCPSSRDEQTRTSRIEHTRTSLSTDVPADITDAVSSYIDCYVSNYPEGDPDGLYVFLIQFSAAACARQLDALRKAATDPENGECATDSACPGYLLDEALAHRRRFVLIVESTRSPGVDFPHDSVFAEYQRDGKYYYVLNRDEVSKKNIALIAEFTSIMAVPSQGGALTPSISVGGGH